MFWRRNWILRVHMYLLSWRKTIFFCVISILSLNQISKLINLTFLYFIGCQNYTKLLIKHASYQILVIALLSSYLSIKHPLSQQSRIIIKYSETAFSNSNVNYFWSIKNSSEVIEKLRLRNFQGFQVSSFEFSTWYTFLPHGLIEAKVLSLAKWCFNKNLPLYVRRLGARKPV